MAFIFLATSKSGCPSSTLLSISLICGCIPSMAFIFLATSKSGCPSSSLLRILAVRAFWMFDGSGLGNGGIGITSGLAGEGGGEGGLEVDEEVIFVHVLVSVGSNGGDESGGEF